MKTALKVILPLLVLALGAGGLYLLIETKSSASKEDETDEGLLVQTTTVHPGRHEVAVEAQGTVKPRQKVALQPQVSGEVVWQNDALVPGGHLEEGERVLRIDQSDYKLALESKQAQVSKARLQLKLERSRQQVARREWKLFRDDEDGGHAQPGSGDAGAQRLALRKPQLRNAEVALESARSAVKKAKLDLRRTVLRAPFNAIVVEENIDRGQVIGPGNPVATLAGTDHFWVQVSVPVGALSAIDVRGVNGADEGSAAVVSQQAGERTATREGRVARLIANLDQVGRMARLLVEIDDPLGLEEGEQGEPTLPLLLGSYVDVKIDARPLEGVFEIPRAALREGHKVYVMSDESQLVVRKVQIAWRRENTVLVSKGLQDGDRVITSRIPTPVEGMKLRQQDGENGKPAVAEARDATGSSSQEVHP